MADLIWVRTRAGELLRRHLPQGWRFAFDHAKTRAGLCNYSTRTISLSRYLAARHSAAEVEQTLLHEIAHAIAGKAAGHGEVVVVARSLGYTGGRTHSGEVASEFAKWVGVCPAGHEVLRFRKPTRRLSCATCSPKFDRAHLLTWYERVPTTRAAG